MDIEVRVLLPHERHLLANVAPGVFDKPIDPRWSAEFFADPRHHLAVAMEAGRVLGMASAVHYVHPDKGPELWINEVGVAASHRSRGLGRRMLAALLAHGRTLGCTQAWVLTDPANTAAQRLYASAGGHESASTSLMFAFAIETLSPWGATNQPQGNDIP